MAFEPNFDGPLDPESIVHGCIEGGHEAILLEGDRLGLEFLDLRSGVAGELLHRLSLYRLRMGVVLPNVAAHGERFEEFAREANRGQLCRFLGTREEALVWLQNEGASGA